MELTRYEPVDPETRATLEKIIQETTNRINRLQQQESENEVRNAKLTSDIKLERQQAELIRQQASNERLSRLQARQSDDEVRSAKLTADIALEQRRADLVRKLADNEHLRADMEGAAAGLRIARQAAVVLEGLNESLPNVSDRISLYRMHTELRARNEDTKNVALGNATLFVTPEDVNLKLGFPRTG